MELHHSCNTCEAVFLFIACKTMFLVNGLHIYGVSRVLHIQMFRYTWSVCNPTNSTAEFPNSKPFCTRMHYVIAMCVLLDVCSLKKSINKEDK
jgi:hypothetical protein